MTNVFKLWLNNTEVIDLEPLSRLIWLEWLALAQTQVSDLTPLEGLRELRSLDLRNSNVEDFSPIQGLQRFVTYSMYGGLRFAGTTATKNNPEIARIAGIAKERARAAALFRYLESSKEPEKADRPDLEEILRGPILAESLADLTKPKEKFEATTIGDGPDRDPDRRYAQLVAILSYAAARMGKTETENRIGRDISASFRDYAEFVQQDPPNPRILRYLAAGIEAAIVDPNLAASLDAFDTAKVSGFLAEHLELTSSYFARSLAIPQYDLTTDPDVLIAELFPKLDSAKEILRKADEEGLFAPSVSDALEMLHRRAEGARKKIVTTGDPLEREAAVAELRRNSVLVTAYLGRIKGRLTAWVGDQAKYSKENPATVTTRAYALYEVAKVVIETLTPVFKALWKLIGGGALPF